MAPDRSTDILASIDLGSHTARLLVARWNTGCLESLLRKRIYIRLAQDFESPKKRTLKQAGVERALKALEEFRADTERLGAKKIRAVATGVVREATDRDRLIDLVREKTGIFVEIVSGEEEARLTGLGIRHALELQDRPFTAFDLGGGTTEFLLVPTQGPSKLFSLPLGAMILTQRHLASDPPEDREIRGMRTETREALLQQLPEGVRDGPLVGTGGTVTTLAAMAHGIGPQEIRPERMNGLLLHAGQVEKLLALLRPLSIAQRATLPGLDLARAEVILAGLVGVGEILNFFHSAEMIVSLTDLLEGALLDLPVVSPSP